LWESFLQEYFSSDLYPLFFLFLNGLAQFKTGIDFAFWKGNSLGTMSLLWPFFKRLRLMHF
jgi:hypothetical protein